MESKEPKEEKETYINTGGTISGAESIALGVQATSFVTGHNFIVNDPSVIGVSNSETIPANATATASNSIALDGRHLAKSNSELNKNNMENKKVTLNNGTVLEVGKKYQVNDDMPFEIKCIGDDMLFVKDEEGIECCQVYNKRMNILPYTPQTPQKEWKTFLIETVSQKTKAPYRFFSQYESEENARLHHKTAISITEVKLNI